MERKKKGKDGKINQQVSQKEIEQNKQRRKSNNEGKEEEIKRERKRRRGKGEEEKEKKNKEEEREIVLNNAPHLKFDSKLCKNATMFGRPHQGGWFVCGDQMVEHFVQIGRAHV